MEIITALNLKFFNLLLHDHTIPVVYVKSSTVHYINIKYYWLFLHVYLMLAYMHMHVIFCCRVINSLKVLMYLHSYSIAVNVFHLKYVLTECLKHYYF